MPSQPLGEASPVMRMLAGASHHTNLGDNKTQKSKNSIGSNLFPLHQLFKADRAGDVFASLHLPPRHPRFNLKIGFETTRVGKTTGEVCPTNVQKELTSSSVLPAPFSSPHSHICSMIAQQKRNFIFQFRTSSPFSF